MNEILVQKQMKERNMKFSISEQKPMDLDIDINANFLEKEYVHERYVMRVEYGKVYNELIDRIVDTHYPDYLIHIKVKDETPASTATAETIQIFNSISNKIFDNDPRGSMKYSIFYESDDDKKNSNLFVILEKLPVYNNHASNVKINAGFIEQEIKGMIQNNPKTNQYLEIEDDFFTTIEEEEISHRAVIRYCLNQYKGSHGEYKLRTHDTKDSSYTLF